MHLKKFLAKHRSRITLESFWRLMGAHQRKASDDSIAYGLEPSPAEASEAVVAVEENQGSTEVYLNTPALTGPQSVLPDYFQNSIVDGMAHGDYRLLRFLRLFDDRILNLNRLLSYRSPLAIRYEVYRESGAGRQVSDSSYFNVATGNYKSRLAPEQLFQYLAHLMPRFRAIRGMRDMLADFVGLNVTVSVNIEEPIILQESSVSRLGSASGHLNQLGGVLMLGTQSNFYFRRLITVLHVDSKRSFDSLVKDKTIFREVKELLRLYTRTSVPVRIMLSCARKYLSTPQLPSRTNSGFRLGRTTVLDPQRKPEEVIQTELLSPVA